MIRERIREVKSIVSKPGETHSAATHYLVEIICKDLEKGRLYWDGTARFETRSEAEAELARIRSMPK